MASTLFEDLGGEPALRPIIDRFVDRVFDDVMIGFFFRNARRERIKQKEYEFAAQHLGADLISAGAGSGTLRWGGSTTAEALLNTPLSVLGGVAVGLTTSAPYRPIAT